MCVGSPQRGEPVDYSHTMVRVMTVGLPLASRKRILPPLERSVSPLFTVRTVKSGDTDLSNGGKIRLRDANGNPTVITLTIV